MKIRALCINQFKVLWKMSVDGNTDQRDFNDASEDFILFKSRILSFEGRDGPAIRGMTFIHC